MQAEGPSLPADALAPALLAWYRQHRRVLPFREEPTAYRIWVSEVMLQQTRMEAAVPYYERFIARLPNVAALAACGEEELHKLWEGLGYYSRARNLQKAARVVAQEHGGQLPASFEALLALPGIGPYTAGAIASIAFGLPHAAVDGNVLRVFARLLCFEEEVDAPAAKKRLAQEAGAHLPKDAPGDYNQALMELGALVCVPGRPRCEACPLQTPCLGLAAGKAETLPRLRPKKARAVQKLSVLVVRREDGAVLLHRRKSGGLLAGLWEPVLLEGHLTKAQAQRRLEGLLPGAGVLRSLPAASHVFTHRVWQMRGFLCAAPMGAAPPAPKEEGWAFALPAQLRDSYALPSAFAAYLPALLGTAVN